MSLASSSKSALLKICGERIACQRQAKPALCLGKPTEGLARITDCAQGFGVVMLERGTGILDEPFEMITGASGLVVGLGGGGLAGEAKGLTQAEKRVAVIGVGGQGRSKMEDGGCFAASKRQAAAKPGQPGMIGRAQSEQAGGFIHVATVDCDPGASRHCLGVGGGQGGQVRLGLGKPAEPAMVLGERQPAGPIVGLLSHHLFQLGSNLGGANVLAASEAPEVEIVEI